jgi:hypothetical protein
MLNRDGPVLSPLVVPATLFRLGRGGREAEQASQHGGHAGAPGGLLAEQPRHFVESPFFHDRSPFSRQGEHFAKPPHAAPARAGPETEGPNVLYMNRA